MLPMTTWAICLVFCILLGMRAISQSGAGWGFLGLVGLLWSAAELKDAGGAIASAVALASRGVHGALSDARLPPEWVVFVALGALLCCAPKAKPRPPRDDGGEARPR